MNFYLSAVDDFVKHETDHPSIGLILCKIQNNVLTKYTLCDIKKPIGLDEYRLEDSLPDARHTSLIYEVLAQYRLIQACDREKIMEFQHGKLSKTLREFIVICRTFNEKQYG